MSLRTISISGAHSGCGKTTIAEKMLGRLADKWGAIKYTKTGLYTSIVEYPDLISQHDKDTCRLINAGASRVLWVQSTPDSLSEVINIAIDTLSDLDGIIVEGNSPVNVFDFDYGIFVFGKDINRFKESAKVPLSKAGVVVCPSVDSFDSAIVLYDLSGKKVISFEDQDIEIIIKELITCS
ncbi:MAG: hypothetical protein HQK91_06140 [Nitrospirae bacterium]|nr:hypothetical protein [Nitrospirota bacterium]MBF0541012.1 hypothetical protein [Nitrospirota bacterium]